MREQIDFKRKPNNYNSYKAFLYVGIPFIFICAIFPIFIIITQEMENDFDVPLLIGVSIFSFAAAAFSVSSSKKQLQTKKSYMNIIDVPIMTLTNDHLIYKFDEVEQYYIPWSQITHIELFEVSIKLRDKLGCIIISYSDELIEYINQIRNDSFIKDRHGDVVISIMYFEKSLDEVYRAIVDYYDEYKHRLGYSE